MKTVAPFFLILLVSCIQHQTDTDLTTVTELSDSVVVSYAEGFDVRYEAGGITILSHAIANNTPFQDSLFLVTDQEISGTLKAHAISSGLDAFVCQSSTHVAFLDILNEIDCVKGLCGMQYVENAKIRNRLNENKAEEICLAEQVSLETLQKIDPDLFLIYPFETDGKEKYTKAGIRTFYIAEYLEQTPLARLEWIKLFGLLTGQVKLANEYFEEVEQAYLSNRIARSDTALQFILNLPYKESWHMPSANSMIVHLIEDAGLTYYYPSSGITENETRSTESVWNDAMYAPYWIIMASRPADFGMSDLLLEEEVYKEFLAVKKKQVIFCNTATSDYFIQGVVEPHIILKDILFATGQITDHSPRYFFLLN